jgi:hypothetical protein
MDNSKGEQMSKTKKEMDQAAVELLARLKDMAMVEGKDSPEVQKRIENLACELRALIQVYTV